MIPGEGKLKAFIDSKNKENYEMRSGSFYRAEITPGFFRRYDFDENRIQTLYNHLKHTRSGLNYHEPWNINDP